MNALDVMRFGPVIPVIVIDRIADAVPLARALVAGGVRVLELTLRTPAALQAIERVAAEIEGAIVGAGTITAARASGLPLLPGVMTPSDVIAARSAGYTELKLFPALQAGGVAMLKALGGPFPDVRFCPTGGISAQTAPQFLALPNVVCVGGSWLTPADAVAAGDWARITALARAASGIG